MFWWYQLPPFRPFSDPRRRCKPAACNQTSVTSQRYKRHLILSEGEHLYYADIKRNAMRFCYSECLHFSGVLSSKKRVWDTWKSKGGNGCLLPPYMSKQLRSNCIRTSARRNEFLRDSSEIDGLSYSLEWSLVILHHSWPTTPSSLQHPKGSH